MQITKNQTIFFLVIMMSMLVATTFYLSFYAKALLYSNIESPISPLVSPCAGINFPEPVFSTGTKPQSVVIGDFDGDGKLDLVVANQNDNTISILLNTSRSNGNISFATKQDFPTGTKPQSVVVGDFDGDGKLDLAVANQNDNTISILLNTSRSNGNISFATKQDFPTGNGIFSVVVGDFDGDGKLDLGVTNHNDNTVSVLRNTSTGTGNVNFAIKQDFTIGQSPYSLVVGDFNSDGKLDLATANFGDRTVSVLLNTSRSNGSINFATKQDFPTSDGAFSVAVGDFDGDGKLDLATGNISDDTVSVLLNQGIISGGRISFATKRDFHAGTMPLSIAVGDFDGDGKLDLASVSVGFDFDANKPNTVSVLRNISSGRGSIGFATKQNFTTGISPYSVAIGDLNSDGKQDLVAANNGDNTLYVLRNISTGAGNINFATKQDFPTGITPQSVVVGDFDGDGKLDLATANSGNRTVSVLLNTSRNSGTVSFTKQDFPTGNGIFSVVVGDFDGDGKLDLAVVNQNDNTVSVLLNTSTGVGNISFATKQDFPTGKIPLSIAVGDFDADGKLDLVTTNNGTISVLRNTSTGTGNVNFAIKQDFSTGTQTNSVVVGDFDKDGKLDLAVTNENVSTVSVLQNTSTGAANISFAPQQIFATGSTPSSIAVGDFDKDGRLDLVTTNNGTISILRNTSIGIGNINFAPQQIFAIATKPRSIVVEDFDGDSKLDLAMANQNDNTVSVLLNTSTGVGNISFATKQDFPTGKIPLSIAVGDFDKDSNLDLVVTNLGNDTISILSNTCSMRP